MQMSGKPGAGLYSSIGIFLLCCAVQAQNTPANGGAAAGAPPATTQDGLSVARIGDGNADVPGNAPGAVLTANPASPGGQQVDGPGPAAIITPEMAPDSVTSGGAVPARPAPAVPVFRAGYFPSRGRLVWSLETGSGPLEGAAPKVTGVRVVVSPRDRRSEVAGTRGQIGPGTNRGQLNLTGLEEGEYEARFYLEGQSAESAPAVYYFRCPGPVEAPIPASASRVPLAPFTPLIFADNHVELLGRKHQLTPLGLWEQVETGGHPLLAGPMTLVTLSGKTPAAKFRVVRSTGTTLATEARLQFPRAQALLKANWDYDGQVRLQLDLESPVEKPAHLEGLELVIPLRAQHARFVRWAGPGKSGNQWLTATQGELWNSRSTGSDFLPYIYLGGEERGLCFYAANDKDWILDRAGRLPHYVVERRGESVRLRVKLGQVYSALGRPRSLSFALMATPVKPMPPQWRRASLGRREGTTTLEIPPSGRDITTLHTGPLASLAARKEEPESLQWQAYGAEWQSGELTPVQPVAGATDPGSGGGPANGGGEAHTNLALVPSRIDYLLRQAQDRLNRGFAGVLWNGLRLAVNENPVVGAGYMMAGGVNRPDADLFALRQLARSAHQLRSKESAGVAETVLWQAQHGGPWLEPATGWMDGAIWPVEPSAEDFQTRFSRQEIRANFLGRTAGVTPILDAPLPDEAATDASAQRLVRSRAGMALTHELKVLEPDELLQRIQLLLEDVGYGATAQVFHYWDEKPVLTLQGVDGAWLLVKGKRVDGSPVLALVLCNYGEEGQPKVKLDTQLLGLRGAWWAHNAEDTSQHADLDKGLLQLPSLGQHDFTLWILGQGTAPEPAPAKAADAVPADAGAISPEGTTPDATPPTTAVTPGAETPATAAPSQPVASDKSGGDTGPKTEGDTSLAPAPVPAVVPALAPKVERPAPAPAPARAKPAQPEPAQPGPAPSEPAVPPETPAVKPKENSVAAPPVAVPQPATPANPVSPGEAPGAPTPPAAAPEPPAPEPPEVGADNGKAEPAPKVP